MYSIKHCLATLLLLFSMGGIAQVKSQEIQFESANPFGFNDIIQNLEAQTKQNVFGQLTVPVDSLNPAKQYPLVLAVAGSLGWRKHHYDYLKMYQEAGFATFELNSFKSRGITSTVGSQDQVTIAAMILDAYRALDVLAQHPNIDKDKVGITGWSLGGGVALFSGWIPLKNAIGSDVEFAAHLPIYPPCFINAEKLEFTQAPIHILIGEVDEWTPAPPCRDLVGQLAQKTNIGLTVYPNAHHSFDSETPITFNEKAYSFKDCKFDLTPEGNVLMNYLNIPMSNSFLQKIGLLFCVERGVNFGGNPTARQASFAFAKSFMEEHLNDTALVASE